MFVYKTIRIMLNSNDLTLHFWLVLNNGWIFGISQLSALWIVDAIQTIQQIQSLLDSLKQTIIHKQ